MIDRARNRAGLALLVFVALVVVLSSVGCGSSATSVKPEVYCFKTVDTAARLVDVGMRAAGDAYAADVLPETAKDKLVAAHAVYQPVAKTALSGCKVVGSRGDADRLISSMQEAADRVIRALVALGVTP